MIGSDTSARRCICLLLGVILSALFMVLSPVEQALSQAKVGTGPLDGGEEMPVRISIRISWNNHDSIPSGNHLETGSMQATITGRAYRLEPGRLCFAPRDGGMTAMVMWRNETRRNARASWTAGKRAADLSDCGHLRMWKLPAPRVYSC